MRTPGNEFSVQRSRPVALLLALVLAVAGVVFGGFAGPAGAAAVDEGSRFVAEPEEPRPDGSCGFRTTVTASWVDSLDQKVLTGRSNGISLFTYEYSFYNEYADPTSGALLFTARGKAKVKDTKARPLGGGLFEITTKETGTFVIVEDGRGVPRGHDSGARTYKYVIDQDGNFVRLISERYPGPESRSMCKIVGSFRGGDSSDRLTGYPLGSLTGAPLGYYEYLPPGYSEDGEQRPLLLFFHGYGGSGDGSAAQLPAVINDAAIPAYINTDNWPAERPFVVLAPQHTDIPSADHPYFCDGEFGGSCVMKQQHEYGNPQQGSPCTTPKDVIDFLNFAVEHYNVDPNRVYLTGLSCGAYGVWEAVPRLSGQIAAAVPVAGEGRPSVDADCAGWTTPTWAFHGAKDDVVEPAGSSKSILKLQTCSGMPDTELLYTEYPEARHDAYNSWDLAYTGTGDEDIFDWMLSHTAG